MPVQMKEDRAVQAAPARGAAVPAVSVRGVSMAFGAERKGPEVLADISFDVGEGEFLCIVGPSGCGKTTLLRLLSGLIRPTAGEIHFHGQRVSGTSRDRAIIFQDYSKALLPWRTVAGNISLSLEACGVPAPERSGRIRALLAKMGLSHTARHYPNQLSGGMQRRAELARAMINEPKVMLMDEPFRGLDAMTRELMQEYYLRLFEESGRTNLFVTSDLEEAIFLADRLIILTNRPTRVKKVMDIDLPRPRKIHVLTSDRFLALRQEALEALHEEALKAFRQGRETPPTSWKRTAGAWARRRRIQGVDRLIRVSNPGLASVNQNRGISDDKQSNDPHGFRQGRQS